MTIALLSKETLVESCRGKSALVRLPVLFFLVYIYWKYASIPQYFSFLDYFNLMMHEAGHLFFMPFGEMMMMLGGTILQLLIPIVCLVAFWRQSDYFSMSFCLGWLGANLFNVAIYMADARAQMLPLLGGDGVGHDWFNIFSQLRVLQYDTMIASGVKLAGIAIMTVSIFSAGWILWVMYTNPKKLISSFPLVPKLPLK